MTDVGRLTYQTGFGNELQSEAEAGALPHGRNSPQQPALGLVSELISGTTFTAPRALNRRTYVFRAMPSVVHGRYQPAEVKTFATPPFTQPPNPNQMRWDPFEIPAGSRISWTACSRSAVMARRMPSPGPRCTSTGPRCR